MSRVPAGARLGDRAGATDQTTVARRINMIMMPTINNV